jgi:transposase
MYEIGIADIGGRVPKAYGIDLRERVLADCDAGKGTTQTALKFKVSPAWIRRLKQQRRQRGDIIPRKGGGTRRCKIDRQKLLQLVRQKPDATLEELVGGLGIVCAKSAVWKALRQLKLSYKKSRSTQRSRTGPT